MGSTGVSRAAKSKGFSELPDNKPLSKNHSVSTGIMKLIQHNMGLGHTEPNK